jgi:hypothetical protein
MPHTKVFHFCPTPWLVKLTTDTCFLQPLCVLRQAIGLYKETPYIALSFSLSIVHHLTTRFARKHTHTHKTKLGLHQPLNMVVSVDVTLSVTNSLKRLQRCATEYLVNTAMEDSWNTQTRHLFLAHRLQPLPGIPEVLRKLTVTVSGQLAGLPQCQCSSQQLTSVFVRSLRKQTKGSLLLAVHSVWTKAWRISLP